MLKTAADLKKSEIIPRIPSNIVYVQGIPLKKAFVVDFSPELSSYFYKDSFKQLDIPREFQEFPQDLFQGLLWKILKEYQEFFFYEFLWVFLYYFFWGYLQILRKFMNMSYWNIYSIFFNVFRNSARSFFQWVSSSIYPRIS